MLKMQDGLSGYICEEKKTLLAHAFPCKPSRYREYGITVWDMGDGHYKFEANCLLDDALFGEICQNDGQWEVDERFSGKGSFKLY